MPSGAIACGVLELAERPRRHGADVRVPIAKGVGHRADRARILELAEAEQADLAEAGVGVLGQRAELARRPRGLLARHHARGDAADAAALVAQRGAEHGEHLRVQRPAGAMADVRARDAGPPPANGMGIGTGIGVGIGAGIGSSARSPPEPQPHWLVSVRPAISHTAGIGRSQRGEQAVDRARVAEVGLLSGQRGREEDCRHVR